MGMRESQSKHLSCSLRGQEPVQLKTHVLFLMRWHRGFGFVTFADLSSAQNALAAEHTIEGRRCEAKVALPKVGGLSCWKEVQHLLLPDSPCQPAWSGHLTFICTERKIVETSLCPRLSLFCAYPNSHAHFACQFFLKALLSKLCVLEGRAKLPHINDVSRADSKSAVTLLVPNVQSAFVQPPAAPLSSLA
eukprot:1161287-Pelagomonas_calceolata.AAC.4